MKKFFIIGTDTDCGKTYVTCRLIENLKKKGHNAFGIKPVMSGNGEDVRLLDAANKSLPRWKLGRHVAVNDYEKSQNLSISYANKSQSICNWELSAPISPHLAALKDGKFITAVEVIEFCNTFDNFDYLLIESAGGLMAPLNDKESWLEVLKLSQIPVILVVGMRLGCLNHALLTAMALEVNKIKIQGWIANCLDPNMLALDENISTLENKLAVPMLTRINFNENFKGPLLL